MSFRLPLFAFLSFPQMLNHSLPLKLQDSMFFMLLLARLFSQYAVEVEILKDEFGKDENLEVRNEFVNKMGVSRLVTKSSGWNQTDQWTRGCLNRNTLKAVAESECPANTSDNRTRG